MEYLLYLIEILAGFLAAVVVLTMHEFAHSYVAYKCGDPTPKFYKRLSLNPFRHFDPIGLVCFALIGFGWAKPVPINPDNFKHYRKGLFLTASAGVIVNYLFAFLVYPLYMVFAVYVCPHLPSIFDVFFSSLFWFLFARSLSFCVFNLLPLYPLDGFRVVDALNRRRGKVYNFLRNYGYYILLGLIIESFICSTFVRYGVTVMGYADILGWFMKFATDIFGYPITALWGLIPW